MDGAAVWGDGGLRFGTEGRVEDAALVAEFLEVVGEARAVGDVRDAGEGDGFVAGREQRAFGALGAFVARR